jgi:DnaD/phage-associated family protein
LARPQKEGLDYFPLDVEMDDEVKLVDAKFGVAGFGVLIKLWQIIYDNGYYIKWTEKELLLYKNRINADINLINDVINECLLWGIFNDDLYKSYTILTSSGVQKRFFEATKRRTEITLVNEFLLASIPENYKPKIKVIPVVIVCRNLKNADSNPQSKVKESKVNIQEEEQEKVGKIFQFYQQNIGAITPFQAEAIGQYLDEGMDPEMIVAVMQDSIGMDVPWSWIKKVLANSDKNNIKTLAQYHAKKAEKERKKDNKSKPQNNKPTFNNFTNRAYDGKKLEEAMINKSRENLNNPELDQREGESIEEWQKRILALRKEG